MGRMAQMRVGHASASTCRDRERVCAWAGEAGGAFFGVSLDVDREHTNDVGTSSCLGCSLGLTN